MSISLSIGLHLAEAPKPSALEPLDTASMVRDLDQPEQALQRARSFIRQGAYKKARVVLAPHRLRVHGTLRAKLYETLALCHLHAGGAAWEQLLQKAHADYQREDNDVGAARTRKYLGEALLNAGAFEGAATHLRAAARGYERAGRLESVAVIHTLLARQRWMQGKVSRALHEITDTIRRLRTMGHGPTLAFASLERSRILAYHGDPKAASEDILTAERVLGTSPDYADRLRARLVRAESWIALGRRQGALESLKRIRHDVARIDNVRIRARVNLLLGEALTKSDPHHARRQLVRAKHLFRCLGFDYWVRACEIFLSNVESQEGLEHQPLSNDLSQWPFLDDMRRVMTLSRSPKRAAARRELLIIRARATKLGNAALALRCDRAMVQLGVADSLDPTFLRMLRQKAHAILRRNTVRPKRTIPLMRMEDRLSAVSTA